MSKELFTLDDGRQITVKQLAKELRISNSGARGRLKQSTDPDVVFRKVGKYIVTSNKQKRKPAFKKVESTTKESTKITKEVQKRMYFDPLGHWALINKWI